MVIDDGGREGEPAAHVTEGVVAHDGDVAQAATDVILGVGQPRLEAAKLRSHLIQTALLGRRDAGDVGLAGAVQDREVAAHPSQATRRRERQDQREHGDDRSTDGHRRQDRVAHDRQQ